MEMCIRDRSNKPRKKEITPVRVCSDRGEIVKKRLIDNLFYVAAKNYLFG